jgi:hypothetical protein
MNRRLNRTMLKDSVCRMVAERKQEQRPADHPSPVPRTLKRGSQPEQAQPAPQGQERLWSDQPALGEPLVSAVRVFRA